MTAAEFPEEQLALVRRTFYANATPKRFFQERNELLQAIAFPAAHLKQRYGVNTPPELSGQILGTVIDTIMRKGNRVKIERFGVYFLHCVQEHLSHHGEEYYLAAKALRRLEDLLPEAVRNVRLGEVQQSTEVLVTLHRTLKSKGGRKKKAPAAQPTLF